MNFFSLFPTAVAGLFIMACGPLSAEEDDAPFNYGEYAAVLKKYVDDRGMVDYGGLKSGRGELDAFVEKVAAVDEDDFDAWPEKKKIAFLINAYNALTLEVIIDHYPIKVTRDDAPKKSILQIPGAWKRLEFEVAGGDYTLDEIEHGLLRKRFNEPRIHMALVCGALSCPKLRNEPYSGARLDAQLDDQTEGFLKQEKKFRIDREKGEVHLSQIFSWFGDDFVKTFGRDDAFEGRGRKERASLNFIARYLGKDDAVFLRNGRYALKYLRYDWTLNEKK